MTSARRSIGALALCAGLLAFASSAGAVANLMDVRVGVHGDHTRIVIETDGEAPYVVDPARTRSWSTWTPPPPRRP